MKRNESGGRMGQLESLVLPVILLLTGLILIGGDRVGLLSLDQIQNLWPVALILIGLSELRGTNADGDDSAARLRGAGSHSGERRV